MDYCQMEIKKYYLLLANIFNVVIVVKIVQYNAVYANIYVAIRYYFKWIIEEMDFHFIRRELMFNKVVIAVNAIVVVVACVVVLKLYYF